MRALGSICDATITLYHDVTKRNNVFSDADSSQRAKPLTSDLLSDP